MTIAESKIFYNNDTKNYILRKNKEFLEWYQGVNKKGYESYLNIEGIQELIFKISSWYELKFPNRSICDGSFSEKYADITDISEYLTMEQLKYRLSVEEVATLESNYRWGSWCLLPIVERYDENGKALYSKEYKGRCGLRCKLEGKEVDFSFIDSGLVNLTDIFYNLDLDYREPVTLERLLDIIENYNFDNADTSQIKSCIEWHNYDLKIRNFIFESVMLSLIYSRNTIPYKGVVRSKLFADEIISEFQYSLPIYEISNDSKSLIKQVNL